MKSARAGEKTWRRAGGTARAVVLLSGGLDSAVAAAWAKAQGRQVFALTLNYGQSHAREIRAARAQALKLGARRHEVLSVPLNRIAAGSLFGRAPARDRAQAAKGGATPATYVTFRNGVFLSLAFSFAEAVGAQEVWGGWCRTDHRGYPDCRPAFFRAMERSAFLGTKAGSQEKRALKVVAPLAGLSKKQTVRQGRILGVDFSVTWSCYAGGRHPCRRCDACRFRAEGFRLAGVADPLDLAGPGRRNHP